MHSRPILEIIVHAVVKIILGFTSYNFDHCYTFIPKLDKNECDYIIYKLLKLFLIILHIIVY